VFTSSNALQDVASVNEFTNHQTLLRLSALLLRERLRHSSSHTRIHNGLVWYYCGLDKPPSRDAIDRFLTDLEYVIDDILLPELPQSVGPLRDCFLALTFDLTCERLLFDEKVVGAVELPLGSNPGAVNGHDGVPVGIVLKTGGVPSCVGEARSALGRAVLRGDNSLTVVGRTVRVWKVAMFEEVPPVPWVACLILVAIRNWRISYPRGCEYLS